MTIARAEKSFHVPSGLHREDYYSQVASTEIVDQHVRIAELSGVRNPYFEFTGKGELMLYTIPVADQVTMFVGPIGAFTSMEIALAIQEQTINYIEADTMGKNFPKDDLGSIQALTGIMIGDFDPRHIFSICEKHAEEGFNPVAGVKAYTGISGSQLSEILTDVEVPSSLSTFQAMRISQVTPTSQAFLQQYGELTEDQIFCVSRLYGQNGKTRRAIELKDKKLPWKALAGLSLGLVTYALQHRDIIPMPEIAVYDTHNGRIQTAVSELFDMRLVANNGEISINNDVMNTVLRWHYGSRDMGGYMEELRFGYADMRQYARKSLEYLSQTGINLILPLEVIDYLL